MTIQSITEVEHMVATKIAKDVMQLKQLISELGVVLENIKVSFTIWI